MPGVDQPQRLRPGHHAHRDVRLDDRHPAVPREPRPRPAVREVPRARRRPAVPAARGPHGDVVPAVVAPRRRRAHPGRDRGVHAPLHLPGVPRVHHAARARHPAVRVAHGADRLRRRRHRRPHRRARARRRVPRVQRDARRRRRAVPGAGPAGAVVAAAGPGGLLARRLRHRPAAAAARLGGVDAVRVGAVRGRARRHPGAERLGRHRAARARRSRRVGGRRRRGGLDPLPGGQGRPAVPLVPAAGVRHGRDDRRRRRGDERRAGPRRGARHVRRHRGPGPAPRLSPGRPGPRGPAGARGRRPAGGRHRPADVGGVDGGRRLRDQLADGPARHGRPDDRGDPVRTVRAAGGRLRAAVRRDPRAGCGAAGARLPHRRRRPGERRRPDGLGAALVDPVRRRRLQPPRRRGWGRRRGRRERPDARPAGAARSGPGRDRRGLRRRRARGRTRARARALRARGGRTRRRCGAHPRDPGRARPGRTHLAARPAAPRRRPRARPGRAGRDARGRACG